MRLSRGFEPISGEAGPPRFIEPHRHRALNGSAEANDFGPQGIAAKFGHNKDRALGPFRSQHFCNDLGNRVLQRLIREQKRIATGIDGFSDILPLRVKIKQAIDGGAHIAGTVSASILAALRCKLGERRQLVAVELRRAIFTIRIVGVVDRNGLPIDIHPDEGGNQGHLFLEELDLFAAIKNLADALRIAPVQRSEPAL